MIRNVINKNETEEEKKLVAETKSKCWLLSVQIRSRNSKLL